MARAGLSQYRVCLLATVLFDFLKWGSGHRPLAARAGWEHAMHQLLHGQEVSAVSVGMSAQFPEVFTLGVHEQVAMGRLPITSCTADSLHVALKAWRQSQVHHSPHIWTVQSHPKCHCGHYNPQVAPHEGLLYSSPFLAAHACMVCFS